MKVLVTGGGGFLGQAICKQLVAHGHAVRSLNRSAHPALGMLALLLALPLTLIVIAAAWITHRPLIGGALIVAGLGLAYLLRRLHRADWNAALGFAVAFQRRLDRRWVDLDRDPGAFLLQLHRDP